MKYLDSSKDRYRKDSSIDGVLLELQLTKKEYYWALSISSDNDFKLHLKRDTNSCFINNYNPVLLKAWQANIDLQQVIIIIRQVLYRQHIFQSHKIQHQKQWNRQFRRLNIRNFLQGKANVRCQCWRLFISVYQNYGPESVSQVLCTWTLMCQMSEYDY